MKFLFWLFIINFFLTMAAWTVDMIRGDFFETAIQGSFMTIFNGIFYLGQAIKEKK